MLTCGVLPLRFVSPKPVLLIVDDESWARALVADVLRRDGLDVAEADERTDIDRLLALDIPNEPKLDVVVHGQRLRTALEGGLLASMRRSSMRVPVVVVTDCAEDSLRDEAEVLGVQVVRRPCDLDSVRSAVILAMQRA